MSIANFEPDRKVITAITNAQFAVVTAAAHGYSTGDIVRINVPQTYGMDLEKIETQITVVNANSFSIAYDTLKMDPFVVPALVSFTSAEVLPISATIQNVA